MSDITQTRTNRQIHTHTDPNPYQHNYLFFFFLKMWKSENDCSFSPFSTRRDNEYEHNSINSLWQSTAYFGLYPQHCNLAQFVFFSTLQHYSVFQSLSLYWNWTKKVMKEIMVKRWDRHSLEFRSTNRLKPCLPILPSAFSNTLSGSQSQTSGGIWVGRNSWRPCQYPGHHVRQQYKNSDLQSWSLGVTGVQRNFQWTCYSIQAWPWCQPQLLARQSCQAKVSSQTIM